ECVALPHLTAGGRDGLLERLDAERRAGLGPWPDIEHHARPVELGQVDVADGAGGLAFDDAAAVQWRVHVGAAVGVHVAQPVLTPALAVGQVLGWAVEDRYDPVPAL